MMVNKGIMMDDEFKRYIIMNNLEGVVRIVGDKFYNNSGTEIPADIFDKYKADFAQAQHQEAIDRVLARIEEVFESKVIDLLKVGYAKTGQKKRRYTHKGMKAQLLLDGKRKEEGSSIDTPNAGNVAPFMDLIDEVFDHLSTKAAAGEDVEAKLKAASAISLEPADLTPANLPKFRQMFLP